MKHPQRALAAVATLSTLVAWAAVPGQARAGTPGNVDSGIRATQCYRTGSHQLVACAGADLPAQDGALGRDTDPATNTNADGLLGLSFTRVCNNGKAEGQPGCTSPKPGMGPKDWGCNVDNLTHIMWEVKAPPGSGWRASDLKYTNYSADYNPVGAYGSATDAQGFVDAVNAHALCGFTDWGLAHTAKVQTILTYGVAGPGAARVDPTYFPTINADWYWNDSPNPSNVATAFGVDFADGSVSNAEGREALRYAQVLRNGKSQFDPDGRYKYLDGGAVVQDTTVTAQVWWRRCVEGTTFVPVAGTNDGTCDGTPTRFTQEQALQWAASESLRTGQPWRVPSVKELNWLVQREIDSPPIMHKAFPDTPAEATWTSTPEVRTPLAAWTIDYGVGLIAVHPRTDALVLRLVRDPG